MQSRGTITNYNIIRLMTFHLAVEEHRVTIIFVSLFSLWGLEPQHSIASYAGSKGSRVSIRQPLDHFSVVSSSIVGDHCGLCVTNPQSLFSLPWGADPLHLTAVGAVSDKYYESFHHPPDDFSFSGNYCVDQLCDSCFRLSFKQLLSLQGAASQEFTPSFADSKELSRSIGSPCKAVGPKILCSCGTIS